MGEYIVNSASLRGLWLGSNKIMNVKALNELGAKVIQMEASFCMSSVHWSSTSSICNYWVDFLGYLMISWQTSEPAPSLLIQPLPQSHPSIRSKELRHSIPFAWGRSDVPEQSLGLLGTQVRITTYWCECQEPFSACFANPLNPCVVPACPSTRVTKAKKRREKIHGTQNGMLTAVAAKLPHPQTLHKTLEYDKKEMILSSSLSLLFLQALPSQTLQKL